jgi:hypothetical protein
MLAEAENALVEAIKSAPIGKRLREVGILPDLEGDSLIKKFFTDAPAVYVVAGSLKINDGAASPAFGLVCISRNSRGHVAARQGDGQMVGLYDIVEYVAAQVDGASIGGVGWRAIAADFITDEKLYQAGVYGAVVRIEAAGPATLPAPLDESALADFTLFASDYDIDNQQPAAEHDKWLQAPPDHSTSVPPLSDTINPQEQ